MKNSVVLDWLFQNGGPVIKYLAVVEHGESPTPNTFDLQQEVLRSRQVQYWMKCLTGHTGFNELHGSRDTCFENAMGKLTLYGLHSSIADFDQRCRPYLTWLQRSMEEDRKDVVFVFHQTIVAAWLAVSGYLFEKQVRDFVLRRLRVIDDFVRENDFCIYVDRSRFKGIPGAYRDYPLVNPELYESGHFPLPWIYDIYAFAALKKHFYDYDVVGRVERVISYVLEASYQQYHDGYGVVLTGHNRYNVMGWNAWLPLFSGLNTESFKRRCLVHRLELMSRFRQARSSEWFKENMKMLASFENRLGRYVLPKEYLRERKNSYFVAGGHMGLGEGRRQRSALEIESSFWMLKIAHAIQEDNKE